MIILGVPVLTNYKGLATLVESAYQGTHTPTELWIINNGTEPINLDRMAIPHGYRDDVKVIYDARSAARGRLSVAQSWNYLAQQYIKTIGSNYAALAHLILSNDDIVLHRHTLAAFADYCYNQQRDQRYPVAISYTAHWSLFYWNVWRAVQTVGLFDEAFWPAYWEDCDYAYRLRLAGLEQQVVDGATCEHTGSQTIRHYAVGEMEEKHHRHFRRNRAYYTAKWGGQNGTEKNTRPFEHAFFE